MTAVLFSERDRLDFNTSSVALHYARILFEKHNSQCRGKKLPCRFHTGYGGQHGTYTKEEIEAMKDVDVRTVDINTLRDIRDVRANTDLPKEEHVLNYIRQIGNPYCYRYGKYVVKISFTDAEATL